MLGDHHIRLEIDPKELAGVERAIVTAVLAAASQAVHAGTLLLEKDLEAITRAAVKGNTFRAWKSRVYPGDGRPVYNPTGIVFGNGGRRTRGMLTYWTKPGINRAKDGYWLAIPTKAAGSTGRGRQLTPGDWERATGMRLQFVYARGHAFLVAEGVSARNRSGALRGATDLRAAMDRARGEHREKQTVVIFVLIPMQRHANTVALEPAMRRARDYMVEGFRQRLSRL